MDLGSRKNIVLILIYCISIRQFESYITLPYEPCVCSTVEHAWYDTSPNYTYVCLYFMHMHWVHSQATFCRLEHIELKFDHLNRRSSPAWLRQVYGYFDGEVNGLTNYTLIPLRHRETVEWATRLVHFRDCCFPNPNNECILTYFDLDIRTAAPEAGFIFRRVRLPNRSK